MEKQKEVQEYYGKTLQTSEDLATNACSCATQLSPETKEALKLLHPEVTKKFYGCGSPIPQYLEGCAILDLGCGGGTDCFVASQLVGEKGKVIGVDMTEQMIATAMEYEQYHWKKFGYKQTNMEFKKGRIQDLKAVGIQDNSIDVVISNCVINLLPSKDEVFHEVWRVLKPGGQIYFSDVFASCRVPEVMQKNKVLWGECISGALYVEDFRRIMNAAGFKDIRMVSKSNITVDNKDLEKQVGSIKFYSITYRAFKLKLQDRPQDYGQVASYIGAKDKYQLDQNYTFPKGEEISICRNTGTILQKSRLCKYFVVSKEGVHRGLKQGKCCAKKEKVKGCC